MSTSDCDSCGYLNDNINGEGNKCMFDQELGTTMCDYYYHFLMNNWESSERDLRSLGDRNCVEEKKKKAQEEKT